ncbi:MAG TPA: hypothetical protein VMH85_11825 [Terriglobales bacterium]|nr:hypothetical protein [Terriglobales bacterium]
MLSSLCFAQQPSQPVTNDFIQSQFGATCSVEGAPPPLIADLDGDGIEDAVITAHCKNPMIDQAEHDFHVIDPYNAYFGYSDVKVTSQFASEDPGSRGAVLLVIHGAGADAWRAATPKAKFVIINLPFKDVSVRKLTLKKKTIMAILTEETGGDNMTSATFWDGKKYRYEPLGAGLE